MAKKFKDFTKFIEERRATSAPYFVAFGETFYLAPTLPVDTVLRFHALSQQDKNAELSADDVFSLFKSIVGEENETKLRKYGEFDVDLMTEIIKFCLEAYDITESKEEVDNTPGPKQ